MATPPRRILLVRGLPRTRLAEACLQVARARPGAEFALLDPGGPTGVLPAAISRVIPHPVGRLSPFTLPAGIRPVVNADSWDEAVLLWHEPTGWSSAAALLLAWRLSPRRVGVYCPGGGIRSFGPLGMLWLLAGRALFWSAAVPGTLLASSLLLLVALGKGRLPDGPVDSYR